ncbi:MAG: mannose-1-phosphate guanylyltransferase [Planctomycetota bacterium]|jgi:mannose-1-phosphate guanylyltransferase
MRYAVIMAGGAGRRLWPMSRLNRPKQLLPLLGGKTLLEIAIDRLKGVFDPDKILVLTNAEYAGLVAEAVPHLPPENIIGEPDVRDTANAIALGVQLLSARDENATMALFTADHVIRPQETFVDAVGLACEVAEQNPDGLVTFGIRPSWPHTGLGYIHCGDLTRPGVHQVVGFKEKPDHAAARQYVETGEHFWNSGMFVWTLGAIRQALEEFLPASMDKLAPVRQAAKAGQDTAEMLKDIYPTLDPISIDYAVMERARNVLMVELECEWLDVGHWPALGEVCALDHEGNVVIASDTIVMDSTRNIIVSEDDHLLAVVGMDDCIVVHARDATLVCNKSDSQRLKDLVQEMESRYGEKFS